MQKQESTMRGPRTAPSPFSAFVRFVMCGGGVGLLSSGAVAGLAVLMPWIVANTVVTVVSTLAATELHARFTFGAGRRAGRQEHLRSAGSAVAAYLVTCAAMAVLHLVQESPGALLEQTVYLAASALAGIGRFVVLRLFVFRQKRTAVATTVSAAVAARPVSAAVVARPVSAAVTESAIPVGPDARRVAGSRSLCPAA